MSYGLSYGAGRVIALGALLVAEVVSGEDHHRGERWLWSALWV